MDESKDLVAETATPKAPRRRLTPEEKIERARAEIARAEAVQRARAMDALLEAQESLQAAIAMAEKAGMVAEAARWTKALAAMGESEAGL